MAGGVAIRLHAELSNKTPPASELSRMTTWLRSKLVATFRGASQHVAGYLNPDVHAKCSVQLGKGREAEPAKVQPVGCDLDYIFLQGLCKKKKQHQRLDCLHTSHSNKHRKGKSLVGKFC